MTGDAQRRYLVLLLSVLAAVLLVGVYRLQGKSLDELAVAMIPDAIVVLLAGPVVYFVLTRHGIAVDLKDGHAPIDARSLASELAGHLEAASARKDLHGLQGFYSSYKQVPWSTLIDESQNSIDLVAYYYDTWANTYHDNLVRFFQRPGTRLRLFVADPRDEAVVKEAQRLFPEYSEPEIRQKIARSGQRLAIALKKAGASSDRLEFYYVPSRLTYSAHCWDDKIMTMGWFEMFRHAGNENPVIEVDLTRSSNVKAFWVKERDGLLKSAKRQQVSADGDPHTAGS